MLNAYPIVQKRKSFDLCAAFLDGYDGHGQMITDGVYRDGASVFYGVDHTNIAAWRQVLAEGGRYFYMDNSYVDAVRGSHFRVAMNSLQHDGHGKSDCARFRKLGVDVKPWRSTGVHIVLCPQSNSFMRDIAGVSLDWTQTATSALRSFTARPIRTRYWDRDKILALRSLSDDLAGAHALVTWSSSAAVNAIIGGVPAVSTGPSAATPMCGDLADIEDLHFPEREQWLGVLADNQWTVAEIRDGVAWRHLNG